LAHELRHDSYDGGQLSQAKLDKKVIASANPNTRNTVKAARAELRNEAFASAGLDNSNPAVRGSKQRLGNKEVRGGFATYLRDARNQVRDSGGDMNRFRKRYGNFKRAGGLSKAGAIGKAWLKLSAVARAGNLQEARVGGYNFSSTQVALPIDLAQKIMVYGKQIVKDTDLADDGRDEHPHITIKYGLHTDDPKLVARALRGVGPIKYKLGAVSKFESTEYDVLKIAVISDDLKRVNARLRRLLKCTDTHPIYNPHVTIAYVRKGFPLPRPSDVFDGATGVADVVEFSAKNGKMHKLRLAQGRGSKMREALSEQTRAMIPKNKFAAPTMERVGHADKGLYPIFDKTSAKSALKLSGKHPHLKREITRRAAVYGVKPEKKGTKYA